MSRTRIGVVGLGLAFTLLSTTMSGAFAAPSNTAASTHQSGRYVVVMKDPALANYTGGIEGLAPTKPEAGEHVQIASAQATSYKSMLQRRQDSVRAQAKVGAPLYTYSTTLNGFSADLSGEQVAALKADSRVAGVYANEELQLDTNNSPDFLGLTGPRGTWAKGGSGKGVIVGVIDSGISPNHPSLADRPDLTTPAKWKGSCVTGDEARFPKSTCNNKLIGAKYFNRGVSYEISEQDSQSPFDVSGHGTHTQTTAAGNKDVPASVSGVDMGKVSGMAYDAQTAQYKVCWNNKANGKNSCFTADIVAAIDAAVADGVDVINYSISGQTDRMDTPVDLAYFNAAAAGVFVAAAAGNEGPDASTVTKAAPWEVSVAAANFKASEGTLTTGDKATYTGSMVEGNTDSLPMVWAKDVAKADAVKPELCGKDTLDPAKAAGKMVVCDRGTHALVDKGAEVKRAGGKAIVIINVPGGAATVPAAFYGIPGVHLPLPARAPLTAYLATPNPTGKLSKGIEGKKPEIPTVADFSSRGPSLTGNSGDAKAPGGAFIKPDIAAPGVNVVAGYVNADPKERFGMISGTSMATPHIAGLAAIIKQARPTWSPMMIKSAMMTTGTKMMGAEAGDPFAEGSGMVNPREFLFPGLVYDSTPTDWANVLVGQGVDHFPGKAILAQDMNYPSISVGQLAGKVTVKRTVTNVQSAPMVYTPKVEGLQGFDVQVTPQRLFVGANKKADYFVTITRKAGTPAYEWVKGNLTWTDMNFRTVRSPIAVRATQTATLGDLTLPAGADKFEAPFTPTEAGTYTAKVAGLVEGVVTPGKLEHGKQVEHKLVLTEAKSDVRIQVQVPNPAKASVVAVLLNTAGQKVGEYGFEHKNAALDIADLPAGEYKLVLVYDASEDKLPIDYQLRTFVLGAADAGNVKLSPTELKLRAAETGKVVGTATLSKDKVYFGKVNFFGSDPASPLATTRVTVG